MLQGTAVEAIAGTPAACVVGTAALMSDVNSQARHATSYLLDMQVEPSNGQWSCIFCGHRNDPAGALATQAVQVKAPVAPSRLHNA